MKRLDTPNLNFDEIFDEKVGLELGEPTKTEDYVENGMRFTKLTWETPKGKFVKIVVSDADDDNLPQDVTPSKTKSLEEELQEAVDTENYELAVVLRDKIKKQKKVK